MLRKLELIFQFFKSSLKKDNQIDDVMAKYQTLTTKKEPEIGQLINIESTSPVEHEKPEKLDKKYDTSRVEGLG